MPLPDEVPVGRLGLDKSHADIDGEVEDSMDEAQQMWRDMKVRKYGYISGFGPRLGKRIM